MSLQLLESEDGDMAETFDIFAEVLPAEIYFHHLFPNFDTPAGKKIAVGRLLEEKQNHHAKFLKVVDTTTGKMAGAALWLVFENEKVPLADDYFDVPGDFWDTQEKKEQAQYAVREFSQFRKNAIEKANGNVLLLDILAVGKKYQRKGVGRMLVKWGTALADQLGYPALVESSEAGRGLYESEGFHTHYRISITWPRKWRHLEEVFLYWLTRPAHGESNGQATSIVSIIYGLIHTRRYYREPIVEVSIEDMLGHM